jgi:hypothetical protein
MAIIQEMVESKGIALRLRQKFLGKEFALIDRYALADALVDTLKATKYRYRADSLLNCHRMFHGRTCRNGHKWAKAVRSCGLRLCPHCCRQRATEVAAKLQPFLAAKDENSLRFMVLTAPNCADLDEGRGFLWAAFGRLRRSVAWKRKVKGCIVTFEATYNPHCVCGLRKRQHEGEDRETDCEFWKADIQVDPWHPHLNVLAEGDYFPHEELCQLWQRATLGQAKVVHISAVKNGFIDLEYGGTSKAARELVKYITKAFDLVDDPIAVEQFLDAVYGRRLLRTYGTFYGLKLEEEIEDRAEVCPDCGTAEWVATGLVTPQQISMDCKGVLRDNRDKLVIDRDVRKALLFDTYKLQRKESNPIWKVAPLRALRKAHDREGLTFDQGHAELLAGIAWFETKRSDIDAAGVN